MDKQYLVIYCTCPNREGEVAERIATTLVDERLAACVNIAPDITSVYRWEEQTQYDSELLLILKTRHDGYSNLENRIRSLHPYEVAEIIALPLVGGNHQYLAWIDASVGDAL